MDTPFRGVAFTVWHRAWIIADQTHCPRRCSQAVSEGEHFCMHAVWGQPHTKKMPLNPPQNSFILCLQVSLLPFLLAWYSSCDLLVLTPLSSYSNSQSTFLDQQTGILFLFFLSRSVLSTSGPLLGQFLVSDPGKEKKDHPRQQGWHEGCDMHTMSNFITSTFCLVVQLFLCCGNLFGFYSFFFVFKVLLVVMFGLISVLLQWSRTKYSCSV